MADNVTLNSGTGGAVAAADDIGSVFYQRVKPNLGADGTAVDAIPVSDGLDTTATGVQAVGLVAQLDDVATGAVTENQFAPVRLSTRRALLVEGVASGTAQPISAASLPLPTGASTSAKQDTIIGHLDGVEGLLTTIDGDTGTLAVVGGGVEATALRVTIASDSTGVLSIDDNGGTITVDGTVAVTNAGLTELAAAINASSQMDVNVATAIPAGNNNIGDVDVASIAAGDNNIGNVDIVSLPASTNTLEVVGDVAHDAGVAGNPVLIAGSAQNMDDTAPPNRISAESDATRLATDWDGTQFVHPHGPQVWSYHVNGSSALTDTTVHAAPGAGLSLYVTDIIISSGAATAMNAFFEETATTVLGPYYLEAVAGRGVALHFVTPKKITANTALTITTSAAIAHSVDVTGFTAQG